eukprot:GHVN01056972.1.p1 GENE.GHVN01056972.1~~GHVN01056972.1.p1  ORF type:complete len:126 (-),score=21.96 GHVN01056972.1:368-745(-)
MCSDIKSEYEEKFQRFKGALNASNQAALHHARNELREVVNRLHSKAAEQLAKDRRAHLQAIAEIRAKLKAVDEAYQQSVLDRAEAHRVNSLLAATLEVESDLVHSRSVKASLAKLLEVSSNQPLS